MASQIGKMIGHYELTEEDCRREVSDADIIEIASSLCGKWKTKLPHLLGMESIIVADIVGAPGYTSEEERRLAFFKEWKQQEGYEATYMSLVSALLKIKCKQDAGSVLRILKKSISTSTAFVSTTPDVASQNTSKGECLLN